MKPEWLEDELLASASDEARVLSIALIVMADDYGRGRASLASIATGAWRYQMEHDGGENAPEILARASRALRELVAIGFVRLYDVGRQRYYELPNWSKHQKVDRPSAPRIPAPNLADSPGIAALARPSRDPRETLDADRDLDLDPEGTSTTTRDGACVPDPARVIALESHIQDEYVRRFTAKLPKGKLPMAARGLPGVGHAVWGELARIVGDESGCADLLDAAFADSFVTGAGCTPNAIKGAADRLLATGAKSDPDMPPPRPGGSAKVAEIEVRLRAARDRALALAGEDGVTEARARVESIRGELRRANADADHARGAA